MTKAVEASTSPVSLIIGFRTGCCCSFGIPVTQAFGVRSYSATCAYLLYEETEELFKRVKATKDICELRNMINVGYLITRQAMERKESRGLHYTIDYPKHAYDQK